MKLPDLLRDWQQPKLAEMLRVHVVAVENISVAMEFSLTTLRDVLLLLRYNS